MIDTDAIATSFRSMLATLYGVAGSTIRPTNQNAPTGLNTDQFATVNISPIEAVGIDQVTQTDDASPATTVTETVDGITHMVITVEWYRGNAVTQASRLKQLMRSSAAADALNAAGLALILVGPVTNLTAVVDDDWEERAQVDVEVYAESKEVSTLQTFGTFPFSVNDGERTTTRTVTNEVNN